MSTNSELIGCDACKGRKTIVGLGSMIENCSKCNGIGWIEAPVSEQDEDEFLKLRSTKTDAVTPEEYHQPIKVNDPFDLIPKKKGRPKKQIALEV